MAAPAQIKIDPTKKRRATTGMPAHRGGRIATSLNDAQLQLRLPSDFIRKFKVYAAVTGKSMSAIVLEHLQSVVDGDKIRAVKK